jgi:hypothetical protein
MVINDWAISYSRVGDVAKILAPVKMMSQSSHYIILGFDMFIS